MTPFSVLAALAGLSHREAAEFHGVRIDTVKSWSSGRNNCPEGALDELRSLIHKQSRAAAETLAQLSKLSPGKLDEIELGYPADDYEAKELGWLCVGAWAAMAARVIAESKRKIKLVPRGSTPATAAAIEARGKSVESSTCKP